jgi:Flp pilus assembly pilin Flp
MEKVSCLESETKREERGASLVEYALLCCLVAVAAIAAIRLLGTNISRQFSTVATQIG